MSLPADPAPAVQKYADPRCLVTTGWLAENLRADGLVVIEVDEETSLYDTGRIPGAIKIEVFRDLVDRDHRDYLSGAAFAELCAAKGIDRDDTIVFYGDNFNWWAAHALWVFSLFKHPDVRLLDGGRQKWIAEGRELTREPSNRRRTGYPEPQRDDAQIRAFRDQVLRHVGTGRPLIDVRSHEEYTGELLNLPNHPQEVALCAGHIPGAINHPWELAVHPDGTFKPPEQLKAIFAEQSGLSQDDHVIIYCRIGERSSHTWFVLRHLLGYPNVRNYDGSWTEWGNLVGAPVARGDRPGRFALNRSVLRTE